MCASRGQVGACVLMYVSCVYMCGLCVCMNDYMCTQVCNCVHAMRVCTCVCACGEWLYIECTCVHECIHVCECVHMCVRVWCAFVRVGVHMSVCLRAYA